MVSYEIISAQIEIKKPVLFTFLYPTIDAKDRILPI